MDLLALEPNQFKAFVLILIRISVVLFLFPIFGGGLLPNVLKAGLAFAVSIVLFSVVRPSVRLFPDGMVPWGQLIFAELVLGLTIGLVVRLFFAAIQLAGQLVGFQMGFAISNVLDPQSGAQGSILAQMVYWTATLIFLLLNGHHIMLSALAESFNVVAVGAMGLHEGLFRTVVDVAGEMFVLAIKIGAPAIAALLITSSAFGIVAKVVPQMNILIVAFPLKIVVGLFFFGLTLEVLLYAMRHYVTDFENMMMVLMRLMRA